MKIEEVESQFCAKYCATGRFYKDHGVKCENPDGLCEHPYPNDYTRAAMECGKAG